MFPRVSHVEHIGGYSLRLTFTDGQEAEIDLQTRILNRGGVFSPLENVPYFARVTVDPEAHTLVWPNGVDLVPDELYSVSTGTPLPVLQTTQ